jgi:sRNA-binding carbon storage regulator CsrA
MNDATEAAKFWFGLGGYFVGITVALIVCIAIIFCQGRRTMLILSRRTLSRNESPAKAETVTITCTCGMHGKILALHQRGQRIRLGFEFPADVQISRDKITPDEVMQDAIE